VFLCLPSVFFCFTKRTRLHSVNYYVYRVPNKKHLVHLQILSTVTHSGSAESNLAREPARLLSPADNDKSRGGTGPWPRVYMEVASPQEWAAPEGADGLWAKDGCNPQGKRGRTATRRFPLISCSRSPLLRIFLLEFFIVTATSPPPADDGDTPTDHHGLCRPV
jgi:hypothetical protein